MSRICHINHPRTQKHSYRENAEILKLTGDHNTRVLLSLVACKFILVGGDLNIFTHAK